MTENPKKSQQRVVGAHVSTSGGLASAVDRAAQMGASAMQVFSGSPRVWARKPLDPSELEKFYSKFKEKNIASIITHSLYLVNLASENPEQVRKSIDALSYDLHFDSAVKGSGIVVHVGSHQGRGWEAVREQIVKAIAEILGNTPDDSTFLIENSAGQNGKVNSELSEIKWVIDQLQTKRVGWCLDTCHTHAAGYSLGSEVKEATKPALQRQQTAEQAIAELDLWQHLKAIHVNDSKDEFGSGRDRHENIGEGKIGLENLRHFLNLPELVSVPLFTEVPGLDGNGPDAANVQRIRDLLA